MCNLDESHLQALELFTGYGKLALNINKETPFQHLLFLIRDWRFPNDYPFGKVGGENLLDNFLQPSDLSELSEVRQNIHSCFEEINAFLLPHPGMSVSESCEFKGHLKDIDKRFLQHMKDLVPLLLFKTNLIVKKFGGEEVKCKQLMDYIKLYVDIFNSNNLPKPATLYQASCQISLHNAVQDTKEKYHELMELALERALVITQEDLNLQHLENKRICLDDFDNKKKMGNEEISKPFRERLEADISQVKNNRTAFFLLNLNSKNLTNIIYKLTP